MAWVERFTCDVCGKLMGESESWWVAQAECAPITTGQPEQPLLRLTPWENVLGHSAGTRHLCGAVCVHTFLDRWMSEARAGAESCAN